jgi:lactate dehydrogenase-like 2-hydroxyacid dehydrogenase
MNIAILDYARIAPDAEFPLLKTACEYRWTQYPLLDTQGVRIDCWRTHVLVTIATPIDAATIAALPLLRDVMLAGDNANLVDMGAVDRRGIRVSQVAADGTPAQRCQRIVEALDALIESSLP